MDYQTTAVHPAISNKTPLFKHFSSSRFLADYDMPTKSLYQAGICHCRDRVRQTIQGYEASIAGIYSLCVCLEDTFTKQ